MTQHVQLNLDDRVYNKIRELATAEGHRPTEYVKLLFDAAYASKVGVATDTGIDAMIARTMVLHSRRAGDTAVIAKAMGISEPLVQRIIAAWKSEIAGTKS